MAFSVYWMHLGQAGVVFFYSFSPSKEMPAHLSDTGRQLRDFSNPCLRLIVSLPDVLVGFLEIWRISLRWQVDGSPVPHV
jgi:hypothetical protein